MACRVLHVVKWGKRCFNFSYINLRVNFLNSKGTDFNQSCRTLMQNPRESTSLVMDLLAKSTWRPSTYRPYNHCSLTHGAKYFPSNTKQLRAYSSVQGEGISHMQVQDVVCAVAKQLDGKLQRHLYIGYGQYFQHATNERHVIMNSSIPLYGAGKEDTFELETLADIAIPSSDNKSLVDSLRRYSDSPVGTGELDFIDKDSWHCGFCNDPNFTIFTKESKLLSTFYNNVERKNFLRVYAYGFCDDYPLDQVASVRLQISDEPWNEQRLDIVLKDDDVITILEKEFSETSDLSLLMVETEWLVKCAGHLCLDCRSRGSNVRLELPQNLTVAGNPWVEMRHQAWVKSLPPSE